MPRAKQKPKLPVAPVETVAVVQAPTTPSVVQNQNNLPLIYPKLDITEYSTTSPKGPLTIEDIVGMLGWETEEEYKERKVKEFPNTKPEVWLFGETFHCRNVAGKKVRCNYNANNRPFDESWCESLIHTHLYGQWAGPFTIPGETVNGETIRISKYGRIISGQHTLTSAKLADEYLNKARKEGTDSPTSPKYPTWTGREHLFLEAIVITGLSEDPRVLMTVDYVNPRTPADVLYTSEVFKSCTPPERKEMCRMLAQAVDMLWTRTDAKGYRTHPEIVAFLDRHKRLLDCVIHLYVTNKVDSKSGRKISRLRLSAGNCAALMYLMACGAVSPDDSDVYRNMEPPTEKGLNFDLWYKASDFWTLLADGKDFIQVRTALGRLVDSTVNSEDNQGLGGRWPEKMAILDKAWELWKDHPANGGAPFSEEDLADNGLLSLSYGDLDDKGNKLPDGQIKLIDVADFGGIDCPTVSASKSSGSKMSKTPDPPAPTKEEIEKATQEAHARRARQATGG